MVEDTVFHYINQCISIESYFISFLLVYMSSSLFRMFQFCILLKLEIDTKNKLIVLQNWYVPTQYTKNEWFGGNFFVIYLACLYGLFVINYNEVTFLYYAFLKDQYDML